MHLTTTDFARLAQLIDEVRDRGDRADLNYIQRLEKELIFAEIVTPENISPDIITMRSRVRVDDIDDGDKYEYSVVFPDEANLDEGKISVLAPLATAILGCKQGDTVEFKAPSRVRRVKVEKILYQPESAGDYDL